MVSARTRYFPAVEGLRGLAALYVFLFHTTQLAIGPHSPFHRLAVFASPLLYGHYAVAIFIVISGFVLGSPVAEKGAFTASSFAKRRLRRIYPAYIAALVLSIPTFYFYAAVVYGKHPTLSHLAIGLALHALLLHNLSPSTITYINPPMWSIALECQIYVVFALILVPIWRKWGVYAQLTAAVALGLLPHFLHHGLLDWSYPWFLGLFGLGVCSASIVARSRSTVPPVTDFQWRLIFTIVAIVAIALVVRNPGSMDPITPGGLIIPDLAIGLATALLLVASCLSPAWFATRVLAWRPIQKLGSFSYSLYLIHIIFVESAAAFLIHSHADAKLWALTIATLVPVTVFVAYAFYLIFEKPFISGSLRSAIERATEPAPSKGDSELALA